MKKSGPAATETVRNGATHRRPNGEAIAARAYEIFLARGGEPGHDLDDWLQAERELMEKEADAALLGLMAVR